MNFQELVNLLNIVSLVSWIDHKYISFKVCKQVVQNLMQMALRDKQIQRKAYSG